MPYCLKCGKYEPMTWERYIWGPVYYHEDEGLPCEDEQDETPLASSGQEVK